MTIRAMASRNFRAFCKTIDPDYQFARHNLAVMDALTYLDAGYFHFLACMMPPRHGKTRLFSQLFPAWRLGRNPKRQIILASYGQSLAISNTRAIRDIVRSHTYQQIFPGVQIREDKSSEKEFEVTRGGSVLAVGVGSALLGRGCSDLILDDLVKDAEEANSQVALENIYQWYANVARTRLHPGGIVGSVMQRWSINDLMGRTFSDARANKEADQWATIKFPALALENDPLGRAVGDALWPARYTKKMLLALRALDSGSFEALFQQNPQGMTGKKFNRDDIQVVDENPITDGKVCRSWDLAITEDESSDYLAGGLVWGKELAIDESVKKVLIEAKMPLPHQLFVEDLVKNRAEWPEQRQVIIETALRDGPGVVVVIEYGRLDLAAVQEIKRDLQGLGCTVRTIKPKGDKVARKGRLQVIARQGHLYFKRADWNEAALREFDDFPGGAHDDVVDCIEQACTYLTKPEFEMSAL